MKHWLWKAAFWWLPPSRRPALGVELKERRLYWSIVTLGIDVGKARMDHMLTFYVNQVRDGEMGIVMDELYAERMIDGRIRT